MHQMHPYAGVLNDQEYADFKNLSLQLACIGPIILGWDEVQNTLPQPHHHWSGCVSDRMLEADIAGVESRVPWELFAAYGTSLNVIVLMAGKLFLPIARSLFPSDEEWLAARAVVEMKSLEEEWLNARIVVEAKRLRASSGQHSGSSWKAVLAWIPLLLVVLLAYCIAAKT